MKIVNVIGGLGNQMFQYAFAIALKSRFPQETVFIDTQHYKNAFLKKYKGNNFYHNGYEINNVFPYASITIAKAKDLIKVSFYIPNQIFARLLRRLSIKRKSEFIADSQPYTFIHEALVIEGDCYYEGYWMNPLYFHPCREKILKEFSFPSFNDEPNINLEKLLVREDSVTIHVRRGDYVGSNTLGGICTIEYYKNAIHKVRNIISNPKFFIFSNEQDWCIDNLGREFGNNEVYFVNNNIGKESYRDMQLMSIARCNILANSSFSWWGAYLNQRKDHIVFCPEKWHNTLEHDGVYLDCWIKVSII